MGVLRTLKMFLEQDNELQYSLHMGIVVSTGNEVPRNEDFWGTERVNTVVLQDVLFAFAKLSNAI